MRTCFALLACFFVTRAFSEIPAQKPTDDDPCRERSSDVEEKQKTIGFIRIGSIGYCTATLLAPKVILTAAHCVAGNEFRKIVFSTREAIPGGEFPHAKVIAIKMHPGFSTLVSPGKAKSDLAVLQLDSTRYGAVPKRFYSLGSADPIASGASGVLVGYGIDPKGVQGVRREKHIRVEKPDDSRRIASGPYLMRVVPGAYGAYPCKGDSGAPLLKFVAGRMAIIGVYSWQTQFNKPEAVTETPEPGDIGQAQYECRTSVAAYATLLPAYREWVATTAKALDPDFYLCGK